MDMIKLKTCYRIIVRLLYYGVIIALTIEISARIDDYLKYEAPLFAKYDNHRLRGRDSNGMRYNIPGARFEKWQNNSLGFRGPEIDCKKPTGATRIFCMGTSETYGLFESAGKEWPAQLSALMQTYGNYQVINAATVGLSRISFIEYMEQFVTSCDPDVVILFIRPSFFDKRPKAVKTQEKSTPRPNNTPEKSAFQIQSILANIRVFPKIRQTIKQFLPEVILTRYQTWDRNKKVERLERDYLKSGKQLIETIPNGNIEAFKSDIIDIVDWLTSKNIRVVLSTYPYLLNKENKNTYSQIALELRRLHIEYSTDIQIESSVKADSITRVISQDFSTGFVDCNSVVPKSLIYFGDAVHLTDSGSEIVAKELEKYISSFIVDRK